MVSMDTVKEPIARDGFVWTVVGVDTTIDWADKDLEFEYQGYRMMIRAWERGRMPALAVQYNASVDRKTIMRFLLEFMSILCWIKRGKIIGSDTITGLFPGNIVGNSQVRYINPGFSLEYLPDITDLDTKLALAYYREAKNVNSIPFQFLGYWKIVSLLHGDGTPEQSRWLVDVLNKIQEQNAVTQLKKVLAQGLTLERVRDHLYRAVRCAIAHATNEPRINPDDPDAIEGVIHYLPIIKAVGEHIIEIHFGICTESVYLRKKYPEWYEGNPPFFQEVALPNI